jgi:DNA-directed RNA polymerase specialized sigma24 family protein
MHEGPQNNEALDATPSETMDNMTILDMCARAEAGLDELPTRVEGTIEEIAEMTGLPLEEIEKRLERPEESAV